MKLHDYQIEARNWIIQNPCCGLFLPPGLGKTLTTLSALKILLDAKAIDSVVIVAPIRVMYMVWPLEIAKWGFDFNYTILHGTNKKLKKSQIYLINPEGLEWFMGNNKQLGKSMLICDESTMFKNHGSVRFKIIKLLMPLFCRRVILTGTPAPNGLMQLWPQVFILDKGTRLGPNISKFRKSYYTQGYMPYDWKLKDGSEEVIYSKIDDIILHKSRDELDMPNLVYNDIIVKLSPTARQRYDELKKELLTEVGDNTITAAMAATLSNKLKQIANGIVYADGRVPLELHNEKLKAISELVDSLAGRPLLVAYEYLHELQILKDYFNAPNIGGGTIGANLNKLVEKWNKGEIPVLLVHPMSAGHGLNLQGGGCTDVCWFSITFDLELYEQLINRVYRQGVSGDVTVHHIVAKGTIDEHVLNVLNGKSKLQDNLLASLLK